MPSCRQLLVENSSSAFSDASKSWRPLKIVQIDVDTGPDSSALPVAPGDHAWIEATKQGQVIGVIGAETEPRLTRAAMKDLSDRIRGDLTPSARHPDVLLSRVSVVVPTICRRPAELVATVESLLAVDYPDFEIIVVDNRTAPGGDPLPQFPGGDQVRTAVERRPGISAARNRGIAAATGAIVAFTDDDAVVAPGWLRAIGATFALDADVEAVGGLVLPREIDTPAQLWFEEFYGGFSRSFRAEKVSLGRSLDDDPLFPYAPARFGSGLNMAFRRSTLERVGGFNLSLGTGTPARGGEDLAMFVELVTAGATVAFEPAALVRHSHRRTEREFMSQVIGYGTGLTAMYTSIIARHPAHLGGLVSRVPTAVRLIARPKGDRSSSRPTSFPRRTLAYQMLGMVYGPLAYARSAARTRRLA
jgi:GT2 family glycosyltransferase